MAATATATATHTRTLTLAHTRTPPRGRHLAALQEERVDEKQGLKPPLPFPPPLTTPPPALSSLLTPRSSSRRCGCSAAGSSFLSSPLRSAPHALSLPPLPCGALPSPPRQRLHYFLPAGSVCAAAAAARGGRSVGR